MITWNWSDTDCKNEWAIFTRLISLTGPLWTGHNIQDCSKLNVMNLMAICYGVWSPGLPLDLMFTILIRKQKYMCTPLPNSVACNKISNLNIQTEMVSLQRDCTTFLVNSVISHTDDAIILLNVVFTGPHGYQITPSLSTNKQGHRLLLLKTGIPAAPTHGLIFEPSVMGGGGAWRPPNHNFVVIAPMIMNFGTGVKLDVFYTMVTKNLWRHYYYYVIMTS